jgi:hypothetical protein
VEVLREADLILGSPPYAGSQQVDNRTEKSSAMSDTWRLRIGNISDGNHPAQLANLPEGDPQATIGSPPYIDSVNSDGPGGIDWEKANRPDRKRETGNGPGVQGNMIMSYGKTQGQLGAMPEGQPTATIGSPPFVGSVGSDDPDKRGGLFRDPRRSGDRNLTGEYGETEGQLGGMVEGELQTENIRQSNSFIYLFFFSPNDSIAALVEISVPSNILAYLSFRGVPVFSIDFNDSVAIGQEEISEISSDLILSSIDNSFVIKEFGKNILKSTLFSLPITMNRAINPTPIFEAMRLNKEVLFANKALFFNASFSEVTQTSNGAEFTLTSIDSRLIGKKFFSALQTGLVNFGSLVDPDAPNGTIICPAFGISGRNVKRFSASSANDSYLSVSPISKAFTGAKFTSSSSDFGGFDLELCIALLTGDINKCSHLLTTPSKINPILTQSDGSGNSRPPVEGVISSPPFEESIPQHDKSFLVPHDSTGNLKADYGYTDGQLGNESRETFWAAARTILEQCYQILPPGGVSIWVVKDFVRDDKRVPFGMQWRQLCEAVGFEHLETHRALLVNRKGEQMTIDGETVELKTERKSFFRLLHQNNQKAKMHWETLGRSDKARYLRESHRECWDSYNFDNGAKDASQPTRNRIRENARKMTWVGAGKPDYEIETSIDYEEVVCMRKPGVQ